MIPTIWWEDRRSSKRPKLYGPDQLLAACVADDLGRDRFGEIRRGFRGIPKKGVGNLMGGLRERHRPIGMHPLCVVLDRDKVLDHWSADKRPAPCKSGICERIRKDAGGDRDEYEFVLLFDNMETLVEAACCALRRAVPDGKNRDERDRVLQQLASSGTPDQRRMVRDEVDGFERLIAWTRRYFCDPLGG